MTWLANRMAEPSTRIGLGILAALITSIAAHPPATLNDWITTGIGAVTGLAAVTTKAPGSPDATPATGFGSR